MDTSHKAEQRESLEDETRAILEEARMVLPGVQALFGFQLVAVFNARFEDLPSELQIVHLVALIAVAVSMSLVMSPAAYHRIAERGRISTRFAEIASWFIAAAMAPLALSIALETFVVGTAIAGSSVAGGIIGASIAVTFVGMWFVWPMIDGRRRRRYAGARPGKGDE